MKSQQESSMDDARPLPTVVEALKACGANERVRMLIVLASARLTLSELARALSRDPTALGHHVKTLVSSRLVLRDKREALRLELNPAVASTSTVEGGVLMTIRCFKGSSVAFMLADADDIRGRGPGL
jgi:DNA-binding transcriptional ArsR family regulator